MQNTIIARIAGSGSDTLQSYTWVRNGEHAVNCQGVRVALVDLRQQANPTCPCCN